MTSTVKNTTADKMVRIWDPVVRVGHWTLVIAFFTAYFTEDDFITQHVWAGYVVGVVVCVRLIWGFTGTEYARFRNFVRSPAHTLGYMRDLCANRARRYIGHNPAGGMMVVALLLSLAGTVYSGLVLYAVEDNAGPLAGLIAHQEAPAKKLQVVPDASADTGKEGRSGANTNEALEEYWEELHEFFANLTLLLVGLHIAGVLFSSFKHHENLIKAMITGKKSIDIDQ